MTSATMMERTTTGFPGMTAPAFPGQGYAQPGVGNYPGQAVNYFSVPRCTFKTEKTAEGCKIHCVCDDPTACSVMQNLCNAMAGGACCCWVTYNGMNVCCYNFTMGLCRWEMTDKGVCFHCTSGDPKCCAAIQTFCECLGSMLHAGCHCSFTVNNTPVCYGCCETGTKTKK